MNVTTIRSICTSALLAAFAAALAFAGGCSCSGGAAGDGDTTIAGRAAVAVEAVAAAYAPMAEGIDIVGTLAAKHAAAIRSEAPGIVMEIYVDEWVPVAAGAALARLDTREADAALQQAKASVEAARAMVLQAQVGEQRAVRELARMQELKNYGLVTRQQYEDAMTAREAAQAMTAATRAQLRVAQEGLAQAQTYANKKIIRSPIAGVIAQRDVNVGSVVSDKIMFRVVDNRMLDLTVSVPERSSAQLRPGQAIVFSSDALAGETFTATVKRVNPAVDARDRAVQVMAEINNGAGPLKDGMFVRGRIITGGGVPVLTIPRPALTAWELGARQGTVFVLNGETVRQATVVTGRSDGIVVEITSGLAAGDRVITGGNYQLQDGDRVTAAVTATPVPAAAAPPAAPAETAPTAVNPAAGLPAAPAPAVPAARERTAIPGAPAAR